MQLGWGRYPDDIPGVSYSKELYIPIRTVETPNSWLALSLASRYPTARRYDLVCLSFSPRGLKERHIRDMFNNCVRHT